METIEQLHIPDPFSSYRSIAKLVRFVPPYFRHTMRKVYDDDDDEVVVRAAYVLEDLGKHLSPSDIVEFTRCSNSVYMTFLEDPEPAEVSEFYHEASEHSLDLIARHYRRTREMIEQCLDDTITWLRDQGYKVEEP